MRKDELSVVLEQMKDERLEHIDEMAMKYADWLKTLRTIKDTFDNPLATDYQMETVRQAVDGLITTHLDAYKKLMK
jgi:hypothetical protein